MPGMLMKLGWEEERPPWAGKELDIIWPIQGKINSPFGPRGKKFHNGIDIASPSYQEVKAAMDGEVIFAHNSRKGFGNAVVLRHDLGLTGTHVGCEHGVCGACTVLFDGQPVRSCLVFAVQADGHEVCTVESLGTIDQLHPHEKNHEDQAQRDKNHAHPQGIVHDRGNPARLQGRDGAHHRFVDDNG
jgi:hypothetical protein